MSEEKARKTKFSDEEWESLDWDDVAWENEEWQAEQTVLSFMDEHPDGTDGPESQG